MSLLFLTVLCCVVQSIALRIAPEFKDDDTAAKLAYLSFIYNEEVTDVEVFDKLDVIYRNNRIIKTSLIPCDLVFMLEKFDALGWQKENCKAKTSSLNNFVNLKHKMEYSNPNIQTEKVAIEGLSEDSEAKLNPNVQTRVMLAPKKSLAGSGIVHKNNTWVEVTRWGNSELIEGFAHGGVYGCWFNTVTGSGVFMNIGRTLVFEQKNEIKAANVATVSDSACPHALKNGYDTIQYVHGLRDYPELILCTGKCSTRVSGPCPGTELRTGLRATKECKCDDRMQILNCGTQIVPDGQNLLCDQDFSYCKKKVMQL